jgi:hypothetical protein
MIFIHLLFWLFIIFLIYILIKYHEYINAILVCIGAIFIEKLHLTHILFNISTYHIFMNYFYWLLRSNSLVTIIGIFLTISICSTLMRMLKTWIQIGVFIIVLYWLGR